MAGDTNGAEEARSAQGMQTAGDAQEKQQAEVSGGSGGGGAGDTDYERAIGERDARIAKQEAQVAEAAKSAQTADELRAQIAELKAQGESNRIDFRLRLTGARNLKAACAVLADHDGNVKRSWRRSPGCSRRPGRLLNRLLRTFPARRAWSPWAWRAARTSATCGAGSASPG